MYYADSTQDSGIFIMNSRPLQEVIYHSFLIHTFN